MECLAQSQKNVMAVRCVIYAERRNLVHFLLAFLPSFVLLLRIVKPNKVWQWASGTHKHRSGGQRKVLGRIVMLIPWAAWFC